MAAPIRLKGSITRRMGRRERERSPVSFAGKFCAASRPHKSRMLVPEFSQSIADLGRRKFPPRTRQTFFLIRMEIPSRRRARSVERQSPVAQGLVRGGRVKSAESFVLRGQGCEIYFSGRQRSLSRLSRASLKKDSQ